MKNILLAVLVLNLISCGGVQFVPNGVGFHGPQFSGPQFGPQFGGPQFGPQFGGPQFGQLPPGIRPDGYNYNYPDRMQSVIGPPGNNAMGFDEWNSRRVSQWR